MGVLVNVCFQNSYPYFYEFLCQKVYFLQNFDDVLVPPDHVSRSYNDTYYIDSQTVLRCHTSAHLAELLRRGHTHFLVTGDVYPRDSIDSTHYPVFHQVSYLWFYQWLFSINKFLNVFFSSITYHADGRCSCLLSRWLGAWFKVAVSVIDSEGHEAYRSQFGIGRYVK